MKIFVYEHITSGALIDEYLPASLAHEGNDMLTTIVNDMAELADIELSILRDNRLEAIAIISNNPRHISHAINTVPEFQQYYDVALNNSDAVLVIAPETDGILQKIQQSVLDKGKKLLGCLPSATQICSDKYECHQHFIGHSIAIPHTILATDWSHHPFTSSTGFIIKPRQGAGCIDTLMFENISALETWLTNTTNNLKDFIIQPYIQGIAISLSALFDAHDSRVLAVNQQYIDLNDGCLSFHGCRVNSISETVFSLKQAADITQEIQNALSGLWGFVGIDLIVTNNKAYIIDINPRLTTAYVGLHQSIGINPAQLLLIMMNKGLAALPMTIERQPIEVLI